MRSSVVSAVARKVFRALEGLASPKLTAALGGVFLHRGTGRETTDFGVGSAANILVLRPDTIGDLVLMSPFLRELRLSNPSAWITLVVDPRFLNIVELCPHVNEVLTFDHRPSARVGPIQLHSLALRLARTHLWQRRFDLALLPRWDIDYYHSAFVAYFSRASCRVGYSEKVFPRKHHFNRNFDDLFTRTIVDHAPKHEVEQNLDFLRAVGGKANDDSLELWLSEQDREDAQKALASRGITRNDLLIGVAPGAGHPKRLWPLGRFIELSRFLQREFGARIVIVGGLEDRDRAFRVQEELGVGAVSFAGEMTLRQTAALLEHAQLMVANDSGPMHLAAAAGSAVVEISCHPVSGDPHHANSPVRFHPWAEEYHVLQPPQPAEPCSSACEWHEVHCILGVSVEAVREAARTLLLRWQSTKSARAGTHDGN